MTLKDVVAMESRMKTTGSKTDEGLIAEIREIHEKREKTIKLLRDVESEVKKQCDPKGPMFSVTKTRIEDGEGGVLDAQTYARKLLIRKIVERVPDETLSGKIERILRSGPEEIRGARVIALEIGENFTVLQKMLKEMNIEARFFETDILANATSTMRFMLDKICSEWSMNKQHNNGKFRDKFVWLQKVHIKGKAV